MDEAKLLFTSLVLLVSSYCAAAVVPEVIPRHAIVKIGDNVTLMCRTGKSLQYCRMEHPSSGRSWNLKPGPSDNGVGYYGSGLDSGDCGVLLQRVTAALNGMFLCNMGFNVGNEDAKGSINLTVAESPASPELFVSQSLDGSGDFKDGEVIQAVCVIRDGRPAANISWYIDEEPIPARDLSMEIMFHTVHKDLYSVQQNLTYKLSWQDHGKALKCVAQHLALEDRNNQSVFQINVRFAPRPHLGDIEQFGFVVGEQGLIKVDVEANPQPSLRWVIGSETISEGQQDQTGRFEAMPIKNKGGGLYEAELRISTVTAEDIQREYALKARNSVGDATYRIVLSTSSEPTVLELGAGAIIGIVVAILVLLLAIFLLIFARATGRWCFAGGVSSRQDPKESSDTESADHGPLQHVRGNKAPSKFVNIFKKKSDKVSDDTEVVSKTRPTTLEDSKEMDRAATLPVAAPKQGQDIVYAELDLKDLSKLVTRRPQVRAEDDKTEYAEIVYTSKPEERSGEQ